MINRKSLKKLSKEQLRGQWTTPVLITLFVVIVQIILVFINFKINEDLSRNFLSTIINTFIAFSISIMINSFYLKLSRGTKVSFSDVFVSGKTYSKGLGIQLLMEILMLPVAIICGIIIAVIGIKYLNSIIYSGLFNATNPSLTSFYIVMSIITLIIFIPIIILSLYFFPALILICENNNRGIWESIKYSFKLMNGNVWSLFVLHLSFIGWSLLCILSLGIGFLWLIPYINTTLLNFYNAIIDNSINNNTNYNDITSLT
ncbi:DUF975 family protein [Clostridium sp.]|uniref:DUF975 family protein n=1 Tax=Clostridium sp. TaxID=1506 RepID=UPI003217C6BF